MLRSDDYLRDLSRLLTDPDRSWSLRRELLGATLVIVGLTTWLLVAVAGFTAVAPTTGLQLALVAAVVGSRLAAATWPDLSRSEVAIAAALAMPAAVVLPGTAGARGAALALVPAAMLLAALLAAAVRGGQPRRRRGAASVAAGLVVAGVGALAVAAVLHGPFAHGSGMMFLAVIAALIAGGAIAAHAAPVRAHHVLAGTTLALATAIAAAALAGGAAASAVIVAVVVATLAFPVPALGAGVVTVWREHGGIRPATDDLPAARVVRGAPPRA